MKGSFWRIATAVFAVGSILYTTKASNRSRKTSRAADPEQEYDVPTEYQQVFDKNMLVPAGWAFGLVWGTVYTGLTAMLVHQALPGQANNPRYEKAVPGWWRSFVLNAVFGTFFSDSKPRSVLMSDLTTKISLPTALSLHQSLEIGKNEVPAPEKYLRIPVSLYSGWLMAASVVGTPDSLLTMGWWERDDSRDVPLAAGILGATAAGGYAVARHLNDPWFMVPFVAGFGGLASRHWNKPGRSLLAYTSAGLALATAGMAAYWVPKGKFRPYEQPRLDADYKTEALPASGGDAYSGLHHQTEIARECMAPIEAEGLD